MQGRRNGGWWVVGAAVVLWVASPACTEDDCPSLAGTWTIMDHCESSTIGTVSTVTQNGCSISAMWQTTPSSGSVTSSGAVSLAVNTGGDILHCTGSAVGDTWTMDCSPGGCHVVTRRTGGGGGSGPGSACNCDSDCSGGTSANPAICVGGVCMNRASGDCTETPGTTAGCPSGSRCWMNGSGTIAVCWPDCASHSCVGTCDTDGSCTPSASTSCSASCGTLCGG